MTASEFRAARQSLGLTVNQMAALLEVRPVHVRKMELDESLPSHRRIMPVTAKLVDAWCAGYRPTDWPQPDRSFSAHMRRNRSVPVSV